MEAQCHACIGGTDVRDDKIRLNQGVHIIVGTPGRVQDMITRNFLSKYVVISSALDIK